MLGFFFGEVGFSLWGVGLGDGFEGGDMGWWFMGGLRWGEGVGGERCGGGRVMGVGWQVRLDGGHRGGLRLDR